MQLRYATISADGKFSDEAVLDERICECCHTSAAMTSEGAIATYRNRSDKEVRDIDLVHREGEGWSRPQPVHTDNWSRPVCRSQ